MNQFLNETCKTCIFKRILLHKTNTEKETGIFSSIMTEKEIKTIRCYRFPPQCYGGAYVGLQVDYPVIKEDDLACGEWKLGLV